MKIEGTVKKPALTLLIAVGLLAIAPTTIAQTAQDPAPATEASGADDARMEQIPHTLKALEEAKAGEYGKLKRDDRRRLETAEMDIDTLKQEHPDLATLDAAERVQLFNAQETIIAIVTGLKRSQLVCTYVQKTGTRFRTKHCMTREMADAAKRVARESTQTAQRDLCVPGIGNPCATETTLRDLGLSNSAVP